MICFSEKQRCKGIWILESEKFSLVECDILGIRTTAQGIRNRTCDWNPESNTWNPEQKKKVQTGKSDITGRLFFITYD